VVKHIVQLLDELGIMPLCEGIETAEELTVITDLGVKLVQGFLLAKPAFESLAAPVLAFSPLAERAA
jgi:EAL domain-containing protein (putative c-di-GMP-specific phosphodiesterase class I)